MTAYQTIFGCAVVLCALSSHPATSQPSFLAWPSAEVARRENSNPSVFGPLNIGMAESTVQSKLGPPASTSKRSSMMMSDEFTYVWEYPQLGVTVYFSAPNESAPGSIMALKVGPPCDWAAVGGLKVGMNIDDTDKILKRQSGEAVTPIGGVGTDTAGLYFVFSDTAIIARLEMGKIAWLYLGPNLQ